MTSTTRIRRPEAAEPGEAALQVAPVPAAAAAVLELQRTAGNRAVGAMLARAGGATATATPEQEFAEFVKAGGWDRAAKAIVSVKSPVYLLLELTVEQLRYLQDSLVRLEEKLGPQAGSVLVDIGITLQTRGVAADKVKPGSTFGEVKWILSPPQDGDRQTGKPYEYGISISFLPDLAAVNADQIAFIQTVRVVDTASDENRDSDEAAKDRHTHRNSSIDSRKGKAQGWYSMKDDKTAGTSLVIWEKSKPQTPAWMLDRPSGTVPNATWDFETAVVCLSGPDEGTVYATVIWGFTTDAALKITHKPQKVTSKQTRDFTMAVDMWNEQAASTDPQRPKNSPTQQQLPALR